MMRAIPSSGFVGLLILAGATSARAQDSYYWSQQYGGASSMLGGNVIGAAVDLGATYYNPATLPFVQPSFAANVQGYEQEWLRITLTGEQTREVRQTRLRATPSLAAIALPSWGENSLAVSVISRQITDQRLAARERVGAATLGQPNPGSTAATLIFDQDVDDWWVGLSWGRSLSKLVSVGVTPFVATRDQHTVLSRELQSTGAAGATAVALRETEAEYWAVRLLAKGGVYLRLGEVNLGVTATTPSLGLFGSGKAFLRHAAGNADLNGDGIVDPDSFAGEDEDVDVRFHTPWAVGAGISYPISWVTLYASAEWYSSVDGYDVLETTVTDAVTGAGERVALHHATDSVVDYGAAVQVAPWEVVALFLSFARDNAARAGREVSLSLASWDYSRVRAGATLRFGWAEIALGLGYRWASGNLRPPTDTPLLQGARVRDRVLDALIGLTVGEST